MTTDVDWEKIRREAIDVRPEKPKRQRRKIDWDRYIDADVIWIGGSWMIILLLALNAYFAEWGWPHIG